MATYVYVCDNGHETEDWQPMAVGPLPTVCQCGGQQRQKFFPSLLVFGDFIIGDDDFSRRYHLNGEAGKYGAKPNRTQGKTNVNAHLRKWGKGGRPLELNPDIDPSKSWDTSKGTPVGIDPSLAAPAELQSSEARGMKLKDES